MFSWSSSSSVKVEQRYREDGKITLAIVVVARLIRDDESSRRVNGIVIIIVSCFLWRNCFFFSRFVGKTNVIL